jgi:hypothetical protein
LAAAMLLMTIHPSQPLFLYLRLHLATEEY